MTEFPDDADGDALRRVAETADLSKPMDVDFVLAVPNEEAGKIVAKLAADRGYAVSVERDDETDEWACYCRRRMLLTHQAVTAAQKELEEIGAPLGGHADGWGTFGNVDS